MMPFKAGKTPGYYICNNETFSTVELVLARMRPYHRKMEAAIKGGEIIVFRGPENSELVSLESVIRLLDRWQEQGKQNMRRFM